MASKTDRIEMCHVGFDLQTSGWCITMVTTPCQDLGRNVKKVTDRGDNILPNLKEKRTNSVQLKETHLMLQFQERIGRHWRMILKARTIVSLEPMPSSSLVGRRSVLLPRKKIKQRTYVCIDSWLALATSLKTGQTIDNLYVFVIQPCLSFVHTHTLSLSLFLGRSLFYIDFFFFPRCVRRVEVCVRANCHVGQGANVSERVWMSMRAWREIFFCLYSSCVRAGMPQFALVVAVILKCSTILVVISEYSTVSVNFPLTSLWSSFLSVLALGPTVILRVYSCLDLGPETGRLQHV